MFGPWRLEPGTLSVFARTVGGFPRLSCARVSEKWPVTGSSAADRALGVTTTRRDPCCALSPGMGSLSLAPEDRSLWPLAPLGGVGAFLRSRDRLIDFTRAAEERGDEWPPPRRRAEGGLDGEQAKSFYEGLLALNSEAATRPGPNPVRKRRDGQRRARGFAEHVESSGARVQGAERSGHLLLKSAQHGDLRTLRTLLEKGACDINFRDAFYWTATMCAAHSGQLEAVNYLLDKGAAWIGVCDTAGRDVLDLARQAGQAAVAALLERYRGYPVGREDRRARPPRRKFCQACRLEYREDSVEQHERSTLHLLSTSDKLPPTHYFIPESNIGFQMMLKGGWNQETGLGPDGKGRKFPVRTLLKRDQKGLGFQTDLRPRVTHFNARDPDAVRQPRKSGGRAPKAATISRREEHRREARQKAWERDLRTSMNF